MLASVCILGKTCLDERRSAGSIEETRMDAPQSVLLVLYNMQAGNELEQYSERKVFEMPDVWYERH